MVGEFGENLYSDSSAAFRFSFQKAPDNKNTDKRALLFALADKEYARPSYI